MSAGIKKGLMAVAFVVIGLIVYNKFVAPRLVRKPSVTASPEGAGA